MLDLGHSLQPFMVRGRKQQMRACGSLSRLARRNKIKSRLGYLPAGVGLGWGFLPLDSFFLSLLPMMSLLKIVGYRTKITSKQLLMVNPPGFFFRR
jgi:hypothetical protein